MAMLHFAVGWTRDQVDGGIAEGVLDPMAELEVPARLVPWHRAKGTRMRAQKWREADEHPSADALRDGRA